MNFNKMKQVKGEKKVEILTKRHATFFRKKTIALASYPPLIIKQLKLYIYAYICRYIYIYNLENRSNDFHKISYEHEKMIQISLNLVKNWVVCLSVILSLNTNLVNLENHSIDFHKIWYFVYFKQEKTI